MAARAFRREKNMQGKNLLGRFEDWMHKNCGMKKKLLIITKIFTN